MSYPPKTWQSPPTHTGVSVFLGRQYAGDIHKEATVQFTLPNGFLVQFTWGDPKCSAVHTDAELHQIATQVAVRLWAPPYIPGGTQTPVDFSSGERVLGNCTMSKLWAVIQWAAEQQTDGRERLLPCFPSSTNGMGSWAAIDELLNPSTPKTIREIDCDHHLQQS